MKLTPWYLAAIAPLAFAGLSGVLVGQLAVLAVTMGIFVGTLSLGREAAKGTDTPVAAVVNAVNAVHVDKSV